MRDKDERIQELLAYNNRMVEIVRMLKAQLRTNTEKFQFYADQHDAKLGKKGFEKGTSAAFDTAAKRDANRELVAENLKTLSLH